MNEFDLARIIKETVKEALMSFGFDTENLHETQSDLIYLRKIRTGKEQTIDRMKNSIFMLAIIPVYIALDWCRRKLWGKS